MQYGRYELRLDRFFEEVFHVGLLPYHVGGGAVGVAAGNDDYRDAGGFVVLQFAQYFEAAELGQHEVQQDEVGQDLAGFVQCFLAVHRFLHLEPFFFYHEFKQFADAVVVVDYQHRFIRGIGKSVHLGHL